MNGIKIERITRLMNGQCHSCKHRSGMPPLPRVSSYTYFSCPAFPLGIPRQISRGDIIHDKILPNQEGITIYEKNGFSKRWEEALKRRRIAIEPTEAELREKLLDANKTLKETLENALVDFDWEKVQIEQTVISNNSSSRYSKEERLVTLNDGTISFLNKLLPVPEKGHFFSSKSRKKADGGVAEAIYNFMRLSYQLRAKLVGVGDDVRCNTIILIIPNEGEIETKFEKRTLKIGDHIYTEKDKFDDYPPYNDEELIELKRQLQVNAELEEEYRNNDNFRKLREDIEELIENEDKERPMSDYELKNKLFTLGHENIQRKDVTIYRKAIKIPDSRLRIKGYYLEDLDEEDDKYMQQI